PVRLADVELADEVPRREDGLRPLAVGPRLSGSRRLPDVRAGAARRAACRLAEGLRRVDREARLAAARDDVADRAQGPLPGVPARAEPAGPVLPADAADPGLRLDDRPAERCLQRDVQRRRDPARTEVVR